MFTEKTKKKLATLKAEYDYVEWDEAVQPIHKKIAKIAKLATLFTMNDIYKHRIYLKGEKGKEDTSIQEVEKSLDGQIERLEVYNKEFGVDFHEVFWQDKWDKLDGIVKPENLLKIFEAFDITRYVKAMREKIEQSKERNATLDDEIERLEKEISNINEALDIEHLERQYQIQQIANQAWKK